MVRTKNSDRYREVATIGGLTVHVPYICNAICFLRVVFLLISKFNHWKHFLLIILTAWLITYVYCKKKPWLSTLKCNSDQNLFSPYNVKHVTKHMGHENSNNNLQRKGKWYYSTSHHVQQNTAIYMYICIWKSVGRNLKQIYRELQLEIKSNQMICKWKNKILIWKGLSVHLSICKLGTSWSRPLSLLQIVSCVIVILTKTRKF